MLINIRERVAAATGALFVVLIVVGNAINVAGTDQSGHASGRRVLKDAGHQASSGAATFGLLLEFIGFAAFIAFLGYLAGTLRRRTMRNHAGHVGPTAVLAGATMLAVKLASAAPGGALRADYEHISPALAQVLNDMGSTLFVVSWLPFGLFIGAAAVALRRAMLVGRPTTYVGVALGAVAFVLAAAGVTDPAAANPLAFMLGLLWILVVSVRLAVRPGGERAAAATSYDASSAAAAGATA